MIFLSYAENIFSGLKGALLAPFAFVERIRGAKPRKIFSGFVSYFSPTWSGSNTIITMFILSWWNFQLAINDFDFLNVISHINPLLPPSLHRLAFCNCLCFWTRTVLQKQNYHLTSYFIIFLSGMKKFNCAFIFILFYNRILRSTMVKFCKVVFVWMVSVCIFCLS